MWRTGYLSTIGRSDLSEAFIQGLNELGYVDGKNLALHFRDATGKNERLAELAADLVRANVDLIATEGTPPTKAALQATSVIPIVFGSAQVPRREGDRRQPCSPWWERDGNGADCGSWVATGSDDR